MYFRYFLIFKRKFHCTFGLFLFQISFEHPVDIFWNKINFKHPVCIFTYYRQMAKCEESHIAHYLSVIDTIHTSRLSKIFEQFNIRFASNFSNIKNAWFEHIQTLNFRIRFASIWTSNNSNISNIFGKLFLAIIGLFFLSFFGNRSQQ